MSNFDTEQRTLYDFAQLQYLYFYRQGDCSIRKVYNAMCMTDIIVAFEVSHKQV